MKNSKILLWLIAMLIFIDASQLQACDLCGCANGGSFFGILPQSHRQFVGLRYRYSSYESHLNSVNLRTKEVFQSTELWGRFYPLKRMQVIAFVPFNFNQQTTLKTGQSANIKGIGDISVLSTYNIFNTFWDTTRVHLIDHSLQLGGGLKLPTGLFKFDENANEGANANFQLGTGSTDFMGSIIYTARYKKWGWNTDITYKINTSNSNNYRFGNRITASSVLFYSQDFGNVTIMPNTGIYFENARHDAINGIKNNLTGGYVTMTNVGTEVYFKRLSMGFTHQIPIVQYLSSGELKANARTTLHFTFMF